MLTASYIIYFFIFSSRYANEHCDSSTHNLPTQLISVKVECKKCAERFTTPHDLDKHMILPCAVIPCSLSHDHEKQRINKLLKDNDTAIKYVQSKDNHYLRYHKQTNTFRCKKKNCKANICLLSDPNGVRAVGCIKHCHFIKKAQSRFWMGGGSPKKLFPTPKKVSREEFEKSVNNDLDNLQSKMKDMYSLFLDGISAVKQKMSKRQKIEKDIYTQSSENVNIDENDSEKNCVDTG